MRTIAGLFVVERQSKLDGDTAAQRLVRRLCQD
jgi:hypothetical protein